MAITDAEMRQTPGERDKWLSMSLGHGKGTLLGRITPSNSRLFYYSYAVPGRKRVLIELGHYSRTGSGGLTLAQAKDKAEELSRLRKQYPDLRGYLQQQRRLAEELERQRLDEMERQRLEAEEAARQAELERQRRLTVRQVFERWAKVELARHIGPNGKPSGRKDGGDYVRQQFERHVFPTLGDMAMADVKRADLLAIFDTHRARGARRTVGVLFSDLKQMFRFAVTRDLIPSNPLEGLRRAEVGGTAGEERERVLTQDEIRLLAERLPEAGLQRRSELAVWLILATACRAGELLAARWDHVDLSARRWRIPAEHSKNGREHAIHLSAFAVRHMAALAELREVGKDGNPTPWLFPDRARKGPVCCKSFGKQLADRQRVSGRRLSRRTTATASLILPGGHWTAHDLRRTAATLMAGELGIHPTVVDECLNHKVQSKVSRTYQVTRRWNEQARAFDALGGLLEQIIESREQASNVIALSRSA